MVRDGLLMILSGPSGSGKGTVVKRLMQEHGELRLSISATTRSPRPGEENGVAYHFFSRDEFERMIIDKEILEYAEYCGNYYGTPREAVELWQSEGQDVLLEIDVQGAEQVKAACPDAVTVFVMPPDINELKRRLFGRKTESQEVVEKRLELAKSEFQKASWYDYIVVNSDVNETADQIYAIIQAEKARTNRMISHLNEVIFDAKT